MAGAETVADGRYSVGVRGGGGSVHDDHRVVHRGFEIAAGPVGVKGKPGGRCTPLDTGRPGSVGGCMNDPEDTMFNALPTKTLIAHSKALEAAGLAITLVIRVPAPLKSIADQAIRSASSVPAKLRPEVSDSGG